MGGEADALKERLAGTGGMREIVDGMWPERTPAHGLNDLFG